MMKFFLFAFLFFIQFQVLAQKNTQDSLNCHQGIPTKKTLLAKNKSFTKKLKNIDNMALIPGGEFTMGSSNAEGRADEYPTHQVKIEPFYLDITEVTNQEFAEFVKLTNYKTVAEKPVDWEELKKQLPENTEKPADSLLAPSSLVFKPSIQEVNLADYNQWWEFMQGADWQHPGGPSTSIKNKENHPVVQVAWEDAKAFCEWQGKRLPTEAEWEFAARGGLKDAIYPWGNELLSENKEKANTWEGVFPVKDSGKDGFSMGTAPVKSYQPNNYGLYDMAGNVWEWVEDNYHSNYYQYLKDHFPVADNPHGPKSSYDPEEPFVPKKVIRGGSFLCNESYCASYRCSARMKSSPDSGLNHTGFRCAKSNIE